MSPRGWQGLPSLSCHCRLWPYCLWILLCGKGHSNSAEVLPFPHLPEPAVREHLWQYNHKRSTLCSLGELRCLKHTIMLNVNWPGKALCDLVWITNGELSKVNKQRNVSGDKTSHPFSSMIYFGHSRAWHLFQMLFQKYFHLVRK